MTSDKATPPPFVDALHSAGVDFVASLPDSRIAPIITAIEEDDRFLHVPLTCEDEGVGVCAGAYFGGRRPCLLIQNSGLLESINDIVTLAIFSQIPLLCVVAYRGTFGEPHWYHGPVGRVTENVIDALGLRYAIVQTGAEMGPALAAARLLAETSSYPVIVLVTLPALEGVSA